MTDTTSSQTNRRIGRRLRLRLSPLLGLLLMLSLAACLLLGLLTSHVSAIPVSSMPAPAIPGHSHRIDTSQGTDSVRAGPVPPNDAYMQLVPGTPGNCPAPPNGGTTNLGCRFVLQLMVNSGSSRYVIWQQSYLSFTYQLLQNVAVPSLGTGCIITNIVTPDISSFEAILQNEVCNGPAPCIFSGGITDPGSIAYASATFWRGRGGTFRVAEIGVCATAPRQGGAALAVLPSRTP